MPEQTRIRVEGEPGLLQLSMMAWVAHAVVQTAVGVALGTLYKASAVEAHDAVIAIHRGGITHVLQGFHYWGSALLILHAVLQVCTTILLGRYGNGERYGLFAALVMVAVSLGFQMTGNLLPFDRHGVQTAAVEYGIATRMPFFGTTIGDLIYGGRGMSDGTLPQWYALHRLLPFGVLLVGWLCWLWVRGGGLKYFKPLLFVPTLVPLLLALVVPSPLGSPATPADYATFDARASWYTWPLHGSMSLFDAFVRGGGWIGAMLIPGIFVAALASAIFAPVEARWPKVVLIAGILYFSIAALFFGGTFASLTGSRDPSAAPAQPAPTGATLPIDAKLAAAGQVRFNAQCAGCHGQDGKHGLGGPSLEFVHQKHPDADYYIRYIQNPRSVKSSSTMPAFSDLKTDELKSIAEYLRGPH